MWWLFKILKFNWKRKKYIYKLHTTNWKTRYETILYVIITLQTVYDIIETQSSYTLYSKKHTTSELAVIFTWETETNYTLSFVLLFIFKQNWTEIFVLIMRLFVLICKCFVLDCLDMDLSSCSWKELFLVQYLFE